MDTSNSIQPPSVIATPPATPTPRKLKINSISVVLVFGLVLLTSSAIFGYKTLLNSKKARVAEQPAPVKTVTNTTTSEAIPDGWTILECTQDGYKIYHPAEMSVARSYPGDTGCPSQYGYSGGTQEALSLHSLNQKATYDKNDAITNESKLVINGIETRYFEVTNPESHKLFVYEYSGNDRYYQLILNSNNQNPSDDLDFTKDTGWGQMVEDYNQTQTTGSAKPVATDIKDIFNKMAKTFVLIKPVPTPVSALEICLETALKNQSENETKACKPTVKSDGSCSVSKEDADRIYQQYQKETNLCYRNNKETNMTDCYKKYPTDTNKEYQCNWSNTAPVAAKPVIYLYPQKQTDVSVTLNYAPGFSATYPAYANGWEVTAYPDGKIINKADNKEYSYLYWEGNPDPSVKYDLSSGFVVKSEDTVSFLQSKLSELGLTPKEYNEFIVYWYPKMKSNPYNLVHFASQSEYDAKAVLKVTPEPDSLLRVFMVYKPISKLVAIEPQQLKAFQRTGFSVVEWGGSELPI